MKKYVALVGGVALSLIVSQAFAFPIEAGEKITVGGAIPGGNDVFIAKTADGTEYKTFCLEYGVAYTVGKTYTVSSVGDAVKKVDKNGSITDYDEISDFTKWIYAAYMDGDIANYQEEGGIEFNAGVVQDFIWYQEEKNDVAGGLVFDRRVEAAYLSLYDKYNNGEVKYSWDDYADMGWDVQVMNFENEGLLGLQKRQSQLVGVKEDTPSEVPEPATMALFGLGLLGFAGATRKRNKK